MFSESVQSAIVRRLYDSAQGDVPWSATLETLAGHFGSSAALLQVSDPDFRDLHVENHGYSLEFADAYLASESYLRDPRLAYFKNVRPGNVYCDRMLYDVEAMLANHHVRENCDTLKVTYQLGVMMKLSDDVRGVLSLLRTDGEGDATDAQVEAYRSLAPHMEQACALGLLLEQQATTQSVLLEALARKADGVIMLSSAGLPVFANDAARHILESQDGLRFGAGGFSTRRGPETRRLNAMIAGAMAASRDSSVPPGGQMLITRPSGSLPLVARVMPAPATDRFLSGPAIACIIHLHDPAALRIPGPETLQTVFGLTPREGDLAAELVRFAELPAAAAKSGMAYNTARAHLQNIFRKCAVSNQMQLVRLFSNLN